MGSRPSRPTPFSTSSVPSPPRRPQDDSSTSVKHIEGHTEVIKRNSTDSSTNHSLRPPDPAKKENELESNKHAQTDDKTNKIIEAGEHSQETNIGMEAKLKKKNDDQGILGSEDQNKDVQKKDIVNDSSNSQTSEAGKNTDNQSSETPEPQPDPYEATPRPLPTLNTDDEVDEHKEFLFAKVNEDISTLNGTVLVPGKSVPPETLLALEGLADLYSSVDNASLKKHSEFRKEVARRMNEMGADRKICDIAVHLHSKGFRDADKDWESYYYCLLNSLNFSDSNALLTETFAAHPDFLPHMRETLNTFCQAFLQGEDKSKITFTVLRLILGIAHNTAMQDIEENIRRLRAEKFTETLMPYLKSDKEKILLNCISTLAEIVDEKESELLQANASAIEFLVRRLRLAMNAPDRRALGWSCHEIARAIGRLARNDGNKKTLVDAGAIPLLLDLSKSEADTKEQEMKDAVQAIWALSFDEVNKLAIVNTEGLIERLFELKKSGTKPIKRACNGILWTLRDTLKNTSKYCDIAAQLFPSDEKSQGHVMISYQWANQKILLDVSGRLKAEKVPVWMDVEDMEGSTLQAMAEAIENAHIVLVCMSQKYKDSPNCRAEAEYAFQKRKHIIPLIMEKGYKADGWLGMILGTKKFHDFSGKYTFEKRIEDLLNEVDKAFKPQLKPDVVDGLRKSDQTELIIQPKRATVTSAPPPVVRDSEEKVKKWTEKEVKKWSNENSIKRVNLSGIRGEDLLYIRNLQHKDPKFFYKVLKENLKLSNVRDLRLFESALNNL